MMLGVFVCIGFMNYEYMGLNFWLVVLLFIFVMGVFGYFFNWGILCYMFG